MRQTHHVKVKDTIMTNLQPLDVGEQLPNESDRHYEARIDEAYRARYDLEVCPDCCGDGYYEVLKWLTYEGDQTWKRHACETCNGDGTLEREEYDALMKEREED